MPKPLTAAPSHSPCCNGSAFIGELILSPGEMSACVCGMGSAQHLPPEKHLINVRGCCCSIVVIVASKPAFDPAENFLRLEEVKLTVTGCMIRQIVSSEMGHSVFSGHKMQG